MGIKGREVLSGWSLSNRCNGFLSLVSSSHFFTIVRKQVPGYLGYEFGIWGLRTGVNIEVDDEGKRPDRHSQRPGEGEGRGEGKGSSAGLDGVMRS